MIIGLTGQLGAGKGTVADFLVKKGHQYYSLSDEIREQLKKNGQKESLENLTKLGNELRKQFGADVLAQRVLQKIKGNKERNIVIDSIRNPQEIELLKKDTSFFLIAVTAPIELRYERIKARKRIDDSVTFEIFEEIEKKQMKGDSTSQQLQKCIELADFEIVNDQDLEYLHQQLDETLAVINESQSSENLNKSSLN